MPIVHGVPLSPFVRKVRVVLAEKGIPYELRPVMPADPSEEFRRISPLGKIPVFQEGEFTLPDSSAIAAYLERAHPEPSLFPSDPQRYGRALWFEEYADSRLAETVGPVFFQRIVSPRVFKKPSDEELVRRTLAEKVPVAFDYLERELGDEEFLVGGRFSIADVAVATQLQSFRHAGEEIERAGWPRLARFAERVLSRPSFKDCIEEEGKLLASR